MALSQEQIKALDQRYQRLVTERSYWEPAWRELAKYILPRKRSIGITSLTPGSKQTEGLMDSTAVRANELLASSMQGSLTSATIRWFRLKLRDREAQAVAEARRWLEEIADLVYSAFQNSNLASELHEGYIDLGCFGTTAVFMTEKEEPHRDPRFRGFQFQTLALGDYVIGENPEGRVDTIFYLYKLSWEAMYRKFGGEYFTPKMTEQMKAEPDKLMTLLHGVYPRQRHIPGAMLSVNKPWASVHLLWEGDEKVCLRESGYDNFPFLVPRWTKYSSEVFGRSPGFTALPDILTLNKAKELDLGALALAIRPPLKVRDSGVIGSVRWTPGGLNSVRDMDAINVLSTGTDWRVTQIKEEELRSSIKEIFHNSQLQFPSNQPMTATEIERRYEIMQRVLGPTLGRLNSELLGPLVERAVVMMAMRQALPPAPQVLRGLNPEVDIEWEGPLARSQKSVDLVAVERTFALLAPMKEVAPDIMDNINTDEGARIAASSAGAPERMIRSKEEVTAIRQARQAEQAKAQQMAEMEQMAGIAQKAAPALKAIAPQGIMPAEMAGANPAPEAA